MLNWFQLLLLRTMRVPPDPAPPDGTPSSIRVFRAGQNYYRLRLARWAMAQIPILFGVLLLTSAALLPKFSRLPGWLQFGWSVVAILAWVVFLAMLAISYYHQRLNFEMRWYIVTDRSLRIRSGVWNMQELTMTFANIQDIRVTAGPLQGYFKLADLEVRSAGGGTGSSHGESSQHAAYFEGVDNAEEIRELILERLRRYRDAGLGDAAHTEPNSAESAALLVLGAARALRRVLAP